MQSYKTNPEMVICYCLVQFFNQESSLVLLWPDSFKSFNTETIGKAAN